MKRFPRELTLMLMIAALSISPCFAQDEPPRPGSTPVNEDPPENVFQIVAEEALKESATDDEIRKLMKARYQNQVGAFELTYEMYRGGRSDFGRVLVASNETLASALELCRTPSEKIAVLEQMVKVTKFLEDLTNQRKEGGSASRLDVYTAKAKSCDAQIQLLRAKQEAAAEKKK